MGFVMQLGMFPRALMKKISLSKDSNMTDILQCLRDLSSDGSEPDNSDWINLVNRGGLMCINNITFELFLAMEYELRSHIGAENICKEAVSHIKTSEDVLFLWDIISTNWEENVASLTIDVVIVTDLLSEHDCRRTDGCTQDSIKKVRHVSYWNLTFIYMHVFSSFV